MKFSLLSTLSLFSTALAADFPSIEVVGNKFFYANNGSQFYIRGVAYQKNTAGLDTDATYIDPLADEDSCKRDIPYLEELGTNVVRVYALNASSNHDACMEALQDAGIYVIADLSSPDESIITDSPAWTLDLYDRYTSVIDMMQSYENVLGFFAGNEVVTNSSNTDSAPFVKAAIRDMKSYISDKGYRSIPVGYSANDDSKTRVGSADYFACGDNDVKADFYGINMYEWCGSKTFQSSGYEDRTAEFSNLTVPVFFSEYGCNTVQPRKFTEVAALFSDEMTDVWSGGIVYMYFEEDNNYGLVSVDGDNVSTLSDFNYLKSEIQSISPTLASAASASASAHELSCPATGSNWKAATSLPPTPDQSVCDCIEKSVKCTVSDDVDEDDYSDLFSIVCNYVDCSDINADGSTGAYGVVSFCDAKDKLAYVLNKYYESEDENSSACDFSGSATTVDQTAGSSCSSIMTLISKSAAKASGSISKGVGTTTGGNKTTDKSDNTDKSTSSTVSSISSSTHSGAAALTVIPGVSGSSMYLFTALITVAVGSVSLIFL